MKQYYKNVATHLEMFLYKALDAQGNVMANYETNQTDVSIGTTAPVYTLHELYMYGSQRLGILSVKKTIVNPPGPVRDDPPVNTTLYSTSGHKQYELYNHLGNVLSTVSDDAPDANHQATLISSNDYYPFGSPMPNRNFSSGEYRYGFNGKEEDGEIKGEGNSLDFGARIYDSRLGRWMSTDPLQDKYPSHSPYNFCANSPILFVDVDGNKFISYINVKQKNETTGKIEKVSYKVVFDGTVTTMQQVVNGKVTGEAIAYNTGTNKFVDDMVTSYNYIVKNGADIDNAMQKIAEMDTEFEVKDRPGKGEYVDGVIKYDFDNGVKVKSKDKTVEGIQSPALGFWSEVYHAYIDKVDLTKKDEFARNPNPLDALAAEETYVHIEKEGQVIDALKKADNTNNEPKRKSYQDGWKNVKTKGPTSTEKK